MRKILLAALSAVVLIATLGLSTGTASASVAGDEARFFALLNHTRAQHGLPPLALNSALSNDARAWSSVMAGRNHLVHTDPARLKREISRVVPHWARYGENIATGSGVDQLHNLLYGSPGHRANMLNGQYSHVGIGVVHHSGRIWVTFRFAAGQTVLGTTSYGSTKSGFYDVPDFAYFSSAVTWLRQKGITTGVGGTSAYQPGQVVTRAQMATFLWRLAGQPSAKAARFADVPSSAYYAPAVAWLRAEGITTGVGGTNRFQPAGAVTREQMASFLHRFAGSKVVNSGHGFSDVGPGFAVTAIRWLVAYDITTGTAPGRFSPRAVVTRAQMAAFLHRLASTPRSFDIDGASIIR